MIETSASQGRTSKIGRAAAAAVESNIEAATETLRTESPSSFVDLFEKSLERTKDMHDKMTAVMQHVKTNYETDIIQPIVEFAASLKAA